MNDARRCDSLGPVGRPFPCSIAPALALVLAGPGCGVGAYEGEVPRADDLALMVPGIDETSAQSGALHALLTTTVPAIQEHFEPVARDLERVVGSIDGHRHDGRDGAARVFGPFEDPDGREVAWIVTAEEVRSTTRWTLSAAADDGAPILVADGSTTEGDDGRTIAWTLWPARHAAAIGDTEFDSNVDADMALEIDVAIDHNRHARHARHDRHDRDHDEARTLTITAVGPSSDGHWLAPVLTDGVQWWSDETGGRLTLRSAVPLPADVLAEPLPGLPWVEAAWNEQGTGEIAAVVPHDDGDPEVLVRECLDPAGRAIFRSIDPASAAAPGQTFGEDHACPGEAVLPQPP